MWLLGTDLSILKYYLRTQFGTRPGLIVVVLGLHSGSPPKVVVDNLNSIPLTATTATTPTRPPRATALYIHTLHTSHSEPSVASTT